MMAALVRILVGWWVGRRATVKAARQNYADAFDRYREAVERRDTRLQHRAWVDLRIAMKARMRAEQDALPAWVARP